MTTADALGWIATIWGVAMAAGPALQVRRIVAERSSAGVAQMHLWILLIGFVLWLAYGVAIGLAPLVITNVIAVIAHVVWIVVARRYQPGHSL